MKSSISGFPEFLPNEQLAFNAVRDKIVASFESYGFTPLDTAAVERVATLLSKGNDKEIYGLFRLADPSDKKDLGLRFDLTVPLARYVADYCGELTFPFKRYQIAPVWRGERPQYGRYRQFYQCDVDVLGEGELSLNYDAEIIALIIRTLKFIRIPPFHVYINNRKILFGFLKTLVDQKHIADVMRILDKADDMSFEEFKNQIIALGVNEEAFEKIKSFMSGTDRGDLYTVLRWLDGVSLNEEFGLGVKELRYVIDILKQQDVPEDLLTISLRLVRGLNYYTGTIFEVKIDNEPEVGSIAGGGRYDNLTSLISKKKCPGVGATIGISRLIPKLIERGLVDVTKSSPADILVTVQDPEYIGTYLRVAENFRKFGVNAEVYLQEKKLKHQMNYAYKKGIKYVFIANDVELLEGNGNIRNLETGTQERIRTNFIGKTLKDLLK